MSPDMIQTHEIFMKIAISEAKKAALKGEVPVGAIIVQNGKILSSGYNKREALTSPLAHAELIAIQKASKKLRAWRLLDCTLYVTLEPCAMCAGALVQARIPHLVFGASDPKGGGVVSKYNIGIDKKLNHSFDVTHGVLKEECSMLLTNFFKKMRNSKP